MTARVRRRYPRWTTLALLALLALGWLRVAARVGPPAWSLPPAGVPVRVLRAIDGDTLLLATGHRVRLIGVDTPETKHPDRPAEPWGDAAAQFTQQWVAGRDVTLEYDRERLDVYRRVLAYVTIDDRLLNEELIRAGFSRAKTSFPYRSDMQRRFRAAEETARQARHGVWSTTTPVPVVTAAP